MAALSLIEQHSFDRSMLSVKIGICHATSIEHATVGPAKREIS